jgi:hypothetical protein
MTRNTISKIVIFTSIDEGDYLIHALHKGGTITSLILYPVEDGVVQEAAPKYLEDYPQLVAVLEKIHSRPTGKCLDWLAADPTQDQP